MVMMMWSKEIKWFHSQWLTSDDQMGKNFRWNKYTNIWFGCHYTLWPQYENKSSKRFYKWPIQMITTTMLKMVLFIYPNISIMISTNYLWTLMNSFYANDNSIICFFCLNYHETLLLINFTNLTKIVMENPMN